MAEFYDNWTKERLQRERDYCSIQYKAYLAKGSIYSALIIANYMDILTRELHKYEPNDEMFLVIE